MKKMVLLGACLMLLAGGCNNEKANENEEVTEVAEVEGVMDRNVSATLSGNSEVPANQSTANGMVEGMYNDSTNVLRLNITYSGVEPTAWHIHKAAAGENGDVVYNLGNEFSSPYEYSTTLTDEQEQDLMNGLLYVNIHSAKQPNGEIRGQLQVQ